MGGGLAMVDLHAHCARKGLGHGHEPPGGGLRAVALLLHPADEGRMDAGTGEARGALHEGDVALDVPEPRLIIVINEGVEGGALSRGKLVLDEALPRLLYLSLGYRLRYSPVKQGVKVVCHLGLPPVS